MTPPYFPIPSALYVVAVALLLSGFMAAAAWIDWKTWRIPKRLTLSMVAAGVLIQVIGGMWMAANELPGWLFHDGMALGVLDGLLFSLAGAATGFAVFFAFWIMGVGGGGDVKLATALGAWVGPRIFIGVLLFTMPVVAVFVVVIMIRRLMAGKIAPAASAKAAPAAGVKNLGRRPMTFSFPLAVATVLLFLVMFRVPLGLSNQ
ncbi:A24 family peptidase [Limnoglobus roseus]|uniref:Prepilin peptidase n=1 Tax=Limnoglobus roseus TaxID=2598579 RepID=A0A5C1A5F2_9BACT|nr:A24 family peptidase [Limnoglobus roseus]QEL13256.1 prepilin peptidase [Limnoglobus roseus]